MTDRRASACALAMVLGTASLAAAAPLLAPARGARAALSLAGVTQVQRLVLDRTALHALRAQRDAVVADFPLGGSARRATLELHRIDPFGPNARLIVMEDSGPRTVAPPDRTWFVGSVRGEPGSRALVVAGPESVHGFVAAAGDVFPFGPDAAGHHRTYALSTADPAAVRPPNEFCLQDVHGAALAAKRQALEPQVEPAPARVPRAASSTLLGVDLAIDTDQELRAKLGSESATLEYIGSLVAAANLIYEGDASVHLHAGYVRVWSTTDPWSAAATDDALDEVQTYWKQHESSVERDAVHFVSGKAVSGGIAWLSALCSTQIGYAVSQVNGAFDTASPNQIWDVLVFTHELGHTLGSPHTHCYSPPVDKCYGSEPGCYDGPVEGNAHGTIMSYCHLNSGGLANIDLLFGDRPVDVIRDYVEGASCVTPWEDDGGGGGGGSNCGNGTVDAGEDCDDGNTAAGDGCSASCHHETTCGDGTVAGNEECDDGNAAAGDGCSAACRREVCGNRVVDPNETCDDGNTAAGDGCGGTCMREPRCGDGVVDAGETCDDGNTAAGDGCSTTCVLEPCAILAAHQTTWAPAKLSWTRSNRTDKLRLRARFGIPASAGAPDVEANGFRVFLTAPDGGERANVNVPPGGWVASGSDRRWRGTPAGGGSVTAHVRDLGGSSVRTVEVRLIASGRWELASGAVPPAVTVVFGGEAAGRAGLCGRYGYGGARCGLRGTRRLTCR